MGYLSRAMPLFFYLVVFCAVFVVFFRPSRWCRLVVRLGGSRMGLGRCGHVFFGCLIVSSLPRLLTCPSFPFPTGLPIRQEKIRRRLSYLRENQSQRLAGAPNVRLNKGHGTMFGIHAWRNSSSMRAAAPRAVAVAVAVASACP